MSAKTKIVVLHMKELIYTAVFAVLGILFVVLLAMMFLPGKDKEKDEPAPAQESEPAMAEVTSLYIPGIYTTQLVLGSESIDVEVIVDKDAITSIRLVNMTDDITTIYPLLQPTLDSICEQVYANQSLESVTYASDSKYTSLVLLEAIQASLDKAMANPDS